MKKFFSAIGHTVYVGAVLIAMVLAGCRVITPMPVPPLAEELGYNVPNYKGITTIGLVEGTLKVEDLKLTTFKTAAESLITVMDAARESAIDWIAMAGMGSAGALPLALKRVPKGAVKKRRTRKSC